MYVELVRPAPHEWSFIGDWHDRNHVCYLCKPLRFPPMPANHTLCARCGALIRVEVADPFNYAMTVCPPCDEEMTSENRALDEMN